MKKKYRVLAVFFILFAALMYYYIHNPDGLKTSQTAQTAVTVSAESTSAAGNTTDAEASADKTPNSTDGSPIAATAGEGIIPGGYINARVARIVDGDTLEAEYEGDEYKVRLLCIDTPETVKRGVDEQPYGKKAKEKLSSLTMNKKVTLIFEKDIDDRYDRLLAYIVLKDGTCVNSLLVEQGYARVDFVRPNTVHRDYFNELQQKAIREKKGLWSLPAERRPFIKNDKGYYVPHYIDKDAA